MAIYRSDQSQLTFGAESAPGAYVELSYGNTLSSGSNGSSPYQHAQLKGAVEAGTIEITVDNPYSSFEFAAGNAIQINRLNHATQESEVRQVLFAVTSGSEQTLTLDAPLAFYHADDEYVNRISSVSDQSSGVYINQLPGIYETVDLPDPVQDIQPAYFLGSASKRNFHRAYSGSQTFSGSIPNMILLNGKALRYPIGKVTSTTTYVNITDTGDNGSPDYGAMLNGATKKGDVYVTIDSALWNNSATNVAQNAYLLFTGQVDVPGSTTISNATTEIRKHIGTASQTLLDLDYPLQFDHADNEVVLIIMTSAGGTTAATTQSIPYTHAISETVDLDTLTWHAHMRASDETSAKDFDRRYYGGKVGNASISAEEGGMLSMSWNTVDFLGMIHNQIAATIPGGGSTLTPFYGAMQPIVSSDVDEPTTEPYYFSQGEVSMFGITIARLRSFDISINNNTESRYYISKRMGRKKGPSEIREGRREYSMSASLALPDADASTTAQRTLFNELLLEGDYGSGKTGFDISLTFTRGTSDTITITIPTSAAAVGGDTQGAFIRSAPHNISTEGVLQADVDILFRGLKIDVQDNAHYYP